MNISQIYPSLGISLDVAGITANSKEVQSNYIFVVLKGRHSNGKNYIKEALANGACLVVSDQHILGSYNHVLVKNAHLEYIRLLRLFYHYNDEIYTVGITGTDGKTTTATMLSSIFQQANNSAYIGTNGIRYLDNNIKTDYTTPLPSILYKALNTFRKHNINDLVMEVSSEGLVDGRVDTLSFKGAIFTNLSHEHLNTHKTMYNYLKAKAKLFESLNKDALAIINADDYYAKFLYPITSAKIVTYGLKNGLYQARNIELSFTSSTFDLFYKDRFFEKFTIPFFGHYNIYNALAAIAYANELGIDFKFIKQGLEKHDKIDGRFMHFTNSQNITGIVDFAHTPNALLNILVELNKFKKGKIITILGAQGEKDASKRKTMGKIASKNSDITIFTSEDPKNESLFGILYDLTKDLEDSEYYLTLSRREAINLACKLANKNDIILITGKGNEQTEKILSFTFKHNDYSLLYEQLNKINDQSH